MLEILLIISLTKKVGAIAEAKGRKPGGFKALVALFWIGGEIVGFLIGGALGLGLGAYGLALLGAGCGAFAAFTMAKRAAPGPSHLPADAEVAAVFE